MELWLIPSEPTARIYAKTTLCNRPSGIYILTEFSEKNITVSANCPPGFPFLSGRCFIFFQPHTNDVCWVRKSCTGEATNWSGKTKNFTRYRARYKIFTAKREKSTGSGFTGCVIEGCANTPAKNLSSAFIYHPSDESIQVNDMALPSVIFARSLWVLFKASHIFSSSLKSPFALCEGIINKYCQLNGSFWGISCFNVIKTGNPRNPDNSQFLHF